jgi:hypothetical protein
MEKKLDTRQLAGDSQSVRLDCTSWEGSVKFYLVVDLKSEFCLLVTCYQKLLHCLLYTIPALYCLYQICNLSLLQHQLASIFLGVLRLVTNDVYYM